jgi:tetratricopeptide (TPR) repeat protein
MTPSTNLFDIIHSLTGSEKRYFKIFSSTHIIGFKNNYEKLFDAYCDLAADKPYDEAAFKKKLAAKPWSKNLTIEKKFLEDTLMKAMRAYNAEKSGEGALNDTIANVHFLYNKGLVNTAMKELKKGIALAGELENLPGLITLYQLKLNLTRITQTPSDIKGADKDLEAETRILNMLDAERRVVHARRKIYNQYIGAQLRKNITGAKSTIQQLELIETNLLTYIARMSLFFLRAMVAEKEGLYEDAMKQYEQANAIWKKNELKLHESYSTLRGILSNYLVCAYYAERHDVYPAIIEQIESFPVENISDQADTFVVAKSSRLVYLLNTQEKDGSENLITEIEKGLKSFQTQIPKEKLIYIYVNICILRFQTKKYSKLVDSLNTAFSLIGRDEKMLQVTLELKFLEIMTHFSLKNYDLLEYQLRNTERWLREHKLHENFTEILIKSFPAMRTEPQFSTIKKELSTLACPDNLQTLKALVLEWMASNLPAKPTTSAKNLVSVRANRLA